MNQKPCFPISTFLAESADSPSQPSNSEEYEQLSLWKLIPTHSSSSDITSQEYQSTQISETTIQNQENLTSLQWDFPARERVTRESELDYLTQNQLSGEREFEYCSKLNPDSVLLNNLKELSDEDFELFLADSIWQDTLSRLKQSRRVALERDTKDSDCLLFPTPTSNECSKGRPAGQTKCEKWFKDKGLIAPGYQLSAEAMALIMGFPPNWFDCLNPTKPQEESGQDISQEEALHQDKQRSLLEESSISIPCLVKQPKQPEVKGVIKQDLGGAAALAERDRFIIYIPSFDSTVTVSKLLVYPDFPESVVQSEKSSSKITPPSTNCSSKVRRKKGEGSGHIYYRTVTRNGKEYRQAYYQWREDGKQRTKYLPRKLLDRVVDAESQKLPVSNILVLLGGDEKCSSKSSDTSSNQKDEKLSVSLDKCSSKLSPPSTKRRKQGYGAEFLIGLCRSLFGKYSNL